MAKRHHKEECVTQELEGKCLLRVAQETIKHPEIISALENCAKILNSHLEERIISKYDSQRIAKAKDDADALHEMRGALSKCIQPDMIDAILEVLDNPMYGDKAHAEIFRRVYNVKKNEHTCSIHHGIKHSRHGTQTVGNNSHSHPQVPIDDNQLQGPSSNPGKNQLDAPVKKYVKVKKCNVKDARKLMKDKKNVYHVNKGKKRGRALIINNRKFDNPQTNRDGTEYDGQNLKSLFDQLHFEVELCEDCPAERMREILDEEASNPQHAEASAFILCILSHGDEGVVQGIDGNTLNIETDIEAKFDGGNCKYLHGKPKIILIQACQGKGKTQGHTMEYADIDTLHHAEVADDSGERHRKSDMLTAISTVPGYVAIRRTDTGSWFMNAIVDVFAEDARDYDILHLLRKVNDVVTKNKTQLEGLVQIPKTSFTLTKNFYFFPGYQ